MPAVVSVIKTNVDEAQARGFNSQVWFRQLFSSATIVFQEEVAEIYPLYFCPV